MKTLLIVGAGLEAVAGIRKAREMGLYVVATDQNPGAPGFPLANEHIVASTYDTEKTVELAQQYHRSVRAIDGVTSIATDVPVTVAKVAQALGLPGISVESALLSADKLAMKRRFSARQLPVPWFSSVESSPHLSKIVATRGYPLVLKPVDSRGSRGVLRLMPNIDLDWAFEFSRSHSPSGRTIVEQFLFGPQISTESLMIEGTAHTLGFSDRNYEFLERYAPHIIENGGELPSVVSASDKEAVCDLVQRAAAHMGIRNGVVKGDVVLFRGRPHIIELAARLSGGYFCSHEIPLNTGVDFVGHAFRLALGEKPNASNLKPKLDQAVAQRYIFPQPGKVVRISRVEEVSRRPGIALCEIRVQTGDIIQPTHSHPDRAGVVIAVGDTREEAINRATAAVHDITIETVPEAEGPVYGASFGKSSTEIVN